jgi:hypothetical protein
VVREIGRRVLSAAIPALERFCRLYAAFGVGGISREQDAALDSLALIGGTEAAQAVIRLIERGDVQGATLKKALNLAAVVGGILPVKLVEAFLGADDPALRGAACRLAWRWLSLAPILVGLLDDIDVEVKISAACALGNMGGQEAMPMLLALLRASPSSDIIDATVSIADEQCIVELGRLARSGTNLSAAAFASLESIDHPLAEKLVNRLNGGTAGGQAVSR